MLPHPEGLGHARGASCPAQPVALGFCRRRARAVPHQGSACCYNYSPRKSSPRCRTRLSQAALPAWQGAEGFIWFNIYDINYGRVASRNQAPGGLFLRCGDLGESLAVRRWLWAAQGGSHPPCELPATGRFTPHQHQQGHRRMLLHLQSPLHGSRLQLCCRGAASVSPSSLQQYLAPTHSANPAPRSVPTGRGGSKPV